MTPLDTWLAAVIVVLGVAVVVLSYRLAVRRAVGDVRRENVALRGKEAAERAFQEKLHAFSRSLRGTLDPTIVATRGLEALGEGLALDRSYLRLAHDGSLDSLTAQWNRPGLEQLRDLGTPGSVEAMREIHRRGRPMVSTDVLTDPFFDTPAGRVWQERTGARGSFTVTVAVEDVPVGILTCLVRRERAWEDHELHWAESVAAELGLALTQAQLYTQRAEAVRRLEELDRAKDDFLSTVSHELRTPLTSIAGYLELLEDDEHLTPDQARTLQVVGRNTERLRLLVENLLALSSQDSGAHALAATPVDLTGLLRGVVDGARPRAEPSGVVLCPVIPDHPVTVVGDPEQLSRALRGIVDNAVKFSGDGGRVAVELYDEPDAECVRAEVRDNGIGIPADDLEAISGTFVRARNAQAAAVPGIGLGLSIAHRIVAIHGGTLTITSEEQRGTCVAVALPRNTGLPLDRISEAGGESEGSLQSRGPVRPG